MATIDLTLDNLLVPAIDGYTPPFGHKITKTPINNGGLSTSEVNSNIMLPFANMRPKIIAENSTTTPIEYDAKLIFSSSLQASVTLGLDDATYEGCELLVKNLSAHDCTVSKGTWSYVVPAEGYVKLEWNGSAWSEDVSSAVHAAIGSGVSSAIATAESYSTTETLTGGTWIDGKPTYEMVVQAETFTSSNPLSVPIPNLDNLVKVKFKRNYDLSHPTWWIFGDGTASTNNLIIKQSTDSISIEPQSSGQTIKNFTGILEYTKKDLTP